MKIAILGTRGIPGRYGGFETFAERLSLGLVEKGHSVAVYGRTGFLGKVTDVSYHGVDRFNAPTLFSKYLETPLAALTSLLHLLFVKRDVDVVILCNAANSIFAFLARLCGVPIIINVDGIERKRAKWNVVGRAWYRLGELFSVLFADELVADAHVISEYYAGSFGRSTNIIAYGASSDSVGKDQQTDEPSVLEQFGLSRKKYLLYVSRLEPENNALGVVRAYNRSGVSYPLVIVGDAPYAKEYIQELHDEASENVVFTGYQFGEAYRELQSHCYLYIQATEVGGTHPALIESMAHGNCIVANGVPEHHEVLRGAGIYYPKNDFAALGGVLSELCNRPELVATHRELAQQEAERSYTWERVTAQYEELCKAVLTPQAP